MVVVFEIGRIRRIGRILKIYSETAAIS
jgi:hypothetical protein